MYSASISDNASIGDNAPPALPNVNDIDLLETDHDRQPKPVMTAIRILVAFLREEHLDEAERLETLQRKISRITVGHLQQVCRIIDIDLNAVPRDGRQVKMPFANAILNKVGDTYRLYFIFIYL